MFLQPVIRKTDSYGSGDFGASRGNRKHNGVDFSCKPNSEIISSVNGIVTKLGYPYADDSSFRYVEITDRNDFKHRIFYVQPQVEINEIISIGDYIGNSQRLGIRYPPKDDVPITEHFHYEIMKIKDGKRKYFNPLTFTEQQ